MHHSAVVHLHSRACCLDYIACSFLVRQCFAVRCLLIHNNQSSAHGRRGSVLQEHARDSFENLLFSLCRFYELTGHYPDNLLVIGYEFKHERFSDLHRAALRWPDQRFQFVGTPALTARAQEVTSTAATCKQIGPTKKEIMICLDRITAALHESCTTMVR